VTDPVDPALPVVPVGPGAPRTLHELAESLGIDPDEAARAEADGTLGLLIVDHLVVPEPGVYTQDEVVVRSGLGEDSRRFWRALGFPDPDPEDRVFSQMDLEMLQMLDAILRLELIERDVALQLVRVIGSSIERIAQSHIDAIEARIDADATAAADGVDEEEIVQLAVQRSGLLLPTVPRVLEYAWRRHVQIAARRRMVLDAMAADGHPAVCVGFADLVGFTALSQQLDDSELADVVDRFEGTAYDVVGGHGGRVVKMIGDEVMFEAPDPATGIEIALELADAFHLDASVSDVRVGVAYGPALAREGDLYGPTVNLASRMVGIAYAGAVVTSSEVREVLADDERFVWKSLRGRYLKHIGRVQLHAVRRAGDTTEGIAERARRRRGLIRDRVAELVDKTVPGRTGDATGEEEEE
jgi:adenylate cyclase